MDLSQPITIQLPGQASEKTFTKLPVILFDFSYAKRVQASVFPHTKPLTLWESEAYDAIGNYTQAQAEARILELLGDNPKSVLESLFVPPRGRVAQT